MSGWFVVIRILHTTFYICNALKPLFYKASGHSRILPLSLYYKYKEEKAKIRGFGAGLIKPAPSGCILCLQIVSDVFRLQIRSLAFRLVREAAGFKPS